MHALNQFLAPAPLNHDDDQDWGQFSTLETPPQPPQYKAKVKSLPRIDEDTDDAGSFSKSPERPHPPRGATPRGPP